MKLKLESWSLNLIDSIAALLSPTSPGIIESENSALSCCCAVLLYKKMLILMCLYLWRKVYSVLFFNCSKLFNYYLENVILKLCILKSCHGHCVSPLQTEAFAIDWADICTYSVILVWQWIPAQPWPDKIDCIHTLNPPSFARPHLKPVEWAKLLPRARWRATKRRSSTSMQRSGI